ncbi:hypothetical protein HK107_01455 [Parvularcula sp. ZS-1/3]|uniref:Uncharacterized protein n=1 Tax=Parvularcula mediterranea TaxID=2732508 RepID=A0A7Y3RJ21_9PROT|nr:hypothetical protein [Parvularcula mediterranea]NNU14989.1 hypothetical protein [Parvularcula mediterranea]
MILRRITQHVRAQNWFAVGIDFVIVVIGVFIGIQLGNWNDARTNAATEQVVLGAILDEVEADLDQLTSAMESAALATAASNHLLEAADLKPLTEIKLPVYNSYLYTDGMPSLEGTSLEAIRGQLWKAIAVRLYPAQSDSAFDGLVSAGNLSLISDPDLVRALQRYKALWEPLEISHTNTYRPFRDRLIFVGQKHGLSPFKGVGEEQLVALLQSDPELEGAVRTVLEYGVLHWQTLNSLHNNADALAVDLRRALGRSE